MGVINFLVQSWEKDFLFWAISSILIGFVLGYYYSIRSKKYKILLKNAENLQKICDAIIKEKELTQKLMREKANNDFLKQKQIENIATNFQVNSLI